MVTFLSSFKSNLYLSMYKHPSCLLRTVTTLDIQKGAALQFGFTEIKMHDCMLKIIRVDIVRQIVHLREKGSY